MAIEMKLVAIKHVDFFSDGTPELHLPPRRVAEHGHPRFLLTSKVMPMMTESDDARVCMIGSVTGSSAEDGAQLVVRGG